MKNPVEAFLGYGESPEGSVPTSVFLWAKKQSFGLCYAKCSFVNTPGNHALWAALPQNAALRYNILL